MEAQGKTQHESLEGAGRFFRQEFGEPGTQRIWVHAPGRSEIA